MKNIDEYNVYYVVNNGEYVFYYGKEILFKNSKNNPFLFVTVEREGVKKQLPLYYCEIEKNTANGYKIKFYNNACTVVCNIINSKGKIYFGLIKNGFQGEKLNINLYKKNSKLTGMGLNKAKDLTGKSISSYAKSGKKTYIDKKLSFSVKNGYYFVNRGIDDWEMKAEQNYVRISTRQSEAGFRLSFGKEFGVEENYPVKLKMTSFSELNGKLCERSYDGFITEYREGKEFKHKLTNLRSKGYKYLIRISPVINCKDADFYDYEEDGLIYIGSGNYLADVHNETNVRFVSNKLRKILDLNADGFYIDEIGINIGKSIIIQDALIYKNFHKLIKKICTEYPLKHNIYNKFISENTINETYSLDYGKIKFSEKKYLRSLLYSDCRSFFYECTPSEAKKLQKRGKKQIIVKNKKLFIF